MNQVSLLLDAMLHTLGLAIASFCFGLALTVFWLVLAKFHPKCQKVIEILLAGIRGLPEYALLLFVYLCVPYLIKQSLYCFWQPNPWLCGFFVLSLVFSACAYEVFQGAIRAHPKEQMASLLGFTSWQQAYLIDGPQLWQKAKPGILNLWLVLLKDTAMVGLIGYAELLAVSERLAKVTALPVLYLGLAGLLYWLLCTLTLRVLNTVTFQKRLF